MTMQSVQCSGITNGERCKEIFQTTEPLHPQATYTCRSHTIKGPDKDRFQDHAFDVELHRPVELLTDSDGVVDPTQRHSVKREPSKLGRFV